ncbi:DNA polymerase III subunit delta' [Candidatus Nanopelagicales bacterium]|nr:DNA polymerase III subunit delta' [Candidatus Nanopelagicales bacterium]
MSVWSRVAGQPRVVAELDAAARAAAAPKTADGAMTHAWLITGPPGSGRSIAAESFAAALVCQRAGCGTCKECREALAGTHPDVDLERSTTFSYSKQSATELVVKAAGAPTRAHYRILVVEDADRMTESAANALLKAIEEPTASTVWILCAPSGEDLLPTIRSRTRNVALRIPDPSDVAAALMMEGVDAGMAGFAAAASQGHIGRARGLANSAEVRSRRTTVLKIPTRLNNLETAYAIAHELKQAADAEAKETSKGLDDAETEELLDAYGQGATGVSAAKVKSHARGALSQLAKNQQQRAARSTRDALDRYFIDLMGWYRDVFVLQVAAGAALINPDLAAEIEQFAGRQDAAGIVARIDALSAARAQLGGNVPPLVVCEALMVQLLHPVPPEPSFG